MVEALNHTDDTVHRGIGVESDEAITFSAPHILPALPSLGGRTLRFAVGEGIALGDALLEPPQDYQLQRRTRRRPRLDLFDVAQIVLILASAAVCIGRLLWAVQP